MLKNPNEASCREKARKKKERERPGEEVIEEGWVESKIRDEKRD